MRAGKELALEEGRRWSEAAMGPSGWFLRGLQDDRGHPWTHSYSQHFRPDVTSLSLQTSPCQSSFLSLPQQRILSYHLLRPQHRQLSLYDGTLRTCPPALPLLQPPLSPTRCVCSLASPPASPALLQLLRTPPTSSGSPCWVPPLALSTNSSLRLEHTHSQPHAQSSEQLLPAFQTSGKISPLLKKSPRGVPTR